MSTNNCKISFTNLLSQYVPGSYLAETKYGSEFRKPGPKIFRCMEHIFMGTSFPLEKSVPPLLKRAHLFLQAEKQSIEELESLTKTLLILERILYGASFFKNAKIKEFQTVCSEEKSLSNLALRTLAKKKNISELKACLELGKNQPLLLEEAYKRVTEKTSLKELSQEELDLLAMITWEKDNTHLLLRIIACGGTPPISSKETQHTLLLSTLQDYNDTTLASLIKHGYDCMFAVEQKINDEKSEIPFPLACIKHGMTKTVRAMIEQKVPFASIKDDEANNALHYAFLIGNAKITKMLFPLLDQTSKNADDQTPLACLLAPKGKKAQELHVNNTKIKKFLEEVLKSNEKPETLLKRNRSVHKEVKQFFEGNYPANCDDVELIYLLSSESLTETLFSRIDRSSFQEACDALSKKHPPKIIEKFSYDPFLFKESHYKTGCEMVTLSDEVEGNPDPEELLTLLRENGSFSYSERAALSSFLEKVRLRTPFLGTPRANTKALKDFYRKIEINLKHIVFSLKEKQDPILTASVLKALINAEPHCGGRYYATAWQQALSVCLGVKGDPRSTLERNIALFRSVCLEGTVQTIYPESDHNAHIFNAALQDFGKSLGIPGYAEGTDFNDIYIPGNYDARKVLDSFRKAYTPYSLIFDWLLPNINDDEDFRSSFIDLLKEFIPKDWTVEDAETEPTEEEKAHDFLGKIMYNKEGKLQVGAIRYLLEQIGVIKCRLG